METMKSIRSIALICSRLESAAKGSENLMPLFVESVENKMSLGEVCNTLRGVWGEYIAPVF